MAISLGILTQHFPRYCVFVCFKECETFTSLVVLTFSQEVSEAATDRDRPGLLTPSVKSTRHSRGYGTVRGDGSWVPSGDVKITMENGHL